MWESTSGCTNLATLSNGEKIAGPKPHRGLLQRQRRLSLSRKRKGSHNRSKAKVQLARHHLLVANIRKDALHKLTRDLTRRFTTIGIEDLNVAGMGKNHALARGIMDQSFDEFRRQLEYQARLTGTVVVADRWYPSSKVCSGCGHRLQALARSQRRWRCPRCGVDHDRDLNAAKNLEQMAVWSTVSAGGEMGSGGAAVGFVKPASTKQVVRSRALPGSDSLCTTAQVIS